MTQAVVIRSTSLDASTLELRSYLEGYFGRNVYVAIERYADLELGCDIDTDNVVTIGRRFLETSGLRYFPRVGWQCGDYIYYSMLPFVEQFSHVWLIEPDVRITLGPADMFERFATVDEDLLGIALGPRPQTWGWYKSIDGYYAVPVHGMYFPVSRLSVRAIRQLFDNRVEYCASERVQGIDFMSAGLIARFANDEAFVATTVLRCGLTSRPMRPMLKRALDGYFSTEIPVLAGEVGHSDLIGKIIHPVCDIERARKKIGIMKRKYPGSPLLAKREQEIRRRLGDEVGNAVFGNAA